jgi:hypothetical protein
LGGSGNTDNLVEEVSAHQINPPGVSGQDFKVSGERQR